MGTKGAIRLLPASILRRVWRINGALAEAENLAQLTETLFENLKSIAPYDVATLYGQDLLTREPLPGAFFLKNYSTSESAKTYSSYYFYKNPILFTMTDPHCRNMGLTQTDFIRQSQFLETEFYVDFFKPMGICHTLFLHAVFQGKMACTLTLHRPPGGPEYTDREKGAVTLIAPMVASSFFAAALQEGLYNPPAPDAMAAQRLLDGLTLRERDIVALIMRGLTNRQIAEHYCISDKTVMTHVTAIMRKTGRKNRVDLITGLLAATRTEPSPER
ncbi:MAG: helix-turn-helix transcriptional regulator [Nitrospinae bacterium]|nr:helix-turn-helix transcriptional regulator [Nitrospinota bacterium]